MAVLRIAICDDDKQLCAALEEMIRSCLAPGVQCQIDLYYTGEQLVYAYEQKQKNHDLIILDMHMPLMTGMEAGRRIRAINEYVTIVILTHYDSFLQQGYEIQTYYYMIKPVNGKKLLEICERLLQKKERGWQDHLNMEVPGSFLHIPYGDIVFLESENRKSHIHLAGGRCVSVYKKLSEMLPFLDNRFVQSHKSFIVNLDYVAPDSEWYTRIKLKGNPGAIPISRRRQKAVMEELKEYLRHGHELI